MATSLASSPDFVTLATNIGVFLVAAATTIAAIWSAVKKIKTALPGEQPSAQKFLGGMIMDNTTLLMWSESNRSVCDDLGALKDEMRELRFAVTQLKDKL